jgi:hypothetical protein
MANTNQRLCKKSQDFADIHKLDSAKPADWTPEILAEYQIFLKEQEKLRQSENYTTKKQEGTLKKKEPKKRETDEDKDKNCHNGKNSYKYIKAYFQFGKDKGLPVTESMGGNELKKILTDNGVTLVEITQLRKSVKVDTYEPKKERDDNGKLKPGPAKKNPIKVRQLAPKIFSSLQRDTYAKDKGWLPPQKWTEEQEDQFEKDKRLDIQDKKEREDTSGKQNIIHFLKEKNIDTGLLLDKNTNIKDLRIAILTKNIMTEDKLRDLYGPNTLDTPHPKKIKLDEDERKPSLSEKIMIDFVDTYQQYLSEHVSEQAHLDVFWKMEYSKFKDRWNSKNNPDYREQKNKSSKKTEEKRKSTRAGYMSKYNRELKTKERSLQRDAERGNIEYKLTTKEFLELYNKTECFICATSLNVDTSYIMRLDQNKGFIFENCNVSCKSCKQSRSNYPLNDMIRCMKNISIVQKNNQDNQHMLNYTFYHPEFDYNSKDYKRFVVNAKKENKVVEISEEEFEEFVEKPCFYCKRDDKKTGLDRIDSNNKKYSLDNIVPCCSMCNRLKSNHEQSDFIEKCYRVFDKWNVESIP